MVCGRSQESSSIHLKRIFILPWVNRMSCHNLPLSITPTVSKALFPGSQPRHSPVWHRPHYKKLPHNMVELTQVPVSTVCKTNSTYLWLLVGFNMPHAICRSQPLQRGPNIPSWNCCFLSSWMPYGEGWVGLLEPPGTVKHCLPGISHNQLIPNIPLSGHTDTTILEQV